MSINKRLSVVIVILFIFTLIFPAQLFADQSWSDVAGKTIEILKKAGSQYGSGANSKALKTVDEAYFGPFENEGMEAAIRLSISSDRAFEHENVFRQIKKAIRQEKPPSVVNKLIDKLQKMLTEDARALDGNGGGFSGWASFLNSFIIIIREGLEAILVVGALTAFLLKSGHKEKIKSINKSIVIALIASVITAVVFKLVISESGASQENLEGFTMLLAVAVLFLVSFWLLSNAQAKKWQEYIKGKIQGSLGKRSTFTIGFAVFLAVYREGAETVLFYQALVASNPPSVVPYILIGFVIGMLGLIAIYALMRFGSVKLPLKPFFTVTGILLYYLAFVFAGQGINELQAGGLVSISPLPGFPVIGFLGIFPTIETLSIQAFLLVSYFSALGAQFWLNRRKALVNNH